jgi:hypothetical protein
VLVSLAGLTTAAATAVFVQLLGAGGWGLVSFVLLLLFLVLYFWISFSWA